MIELSADLAEGSPREDEIWPMIDAANVACGGHVGDESSMADAVRRALEHDVVLGAHPSYPDRENFGRRSLQIEPSALKDAIVTQLETLRSIAARAGIELQRVKPHGALYNDAHRDRERARVIVDAIQEVDRSLRLVCPAHSMMAAVADASGISVIREAFADRRYEPDGSLVSRSMAGSLLSIEEAAGQARSLFADGTLITRDGAQIRISFDTVCVHADMEGAVERLRAIREAITR